MHPAAHAADPEDGVEGTSRLSKAHTKVSPSFPGLEGLQVWTPTASSLAILMETFLPSVSD